MSIAGPGAIFSLPAFFIAFRETLEAGVVLSVLLNVLKKTDLTRLNKWVWYGVALGLLVTVLLLVGTIAAFNIAADRIIDNVSNETATEEGEVDPLRVAATLRLRAVLSFSAGILIAIMTWTMDGIIQKQKELEAQQERGEEDKQEEVVNWWTVFFLSGTTVAREGAETVIFLLIVNAFDWKSIPLAVFVGLLSGSFAGWLLYRIGSRLAVTWFFRFSVVLLMFIGAGIFAHGMEEVLQLRNYEMGWFSHIVYNISWCCSTVRSEGWALFRALFGYTAYPSRLEIIGYFGYHLVIILGFLIKWRLRKMSRRKKEAEKEEDQEKGDVQVENKAVEVTF